MGGRNLRPASKIALGGMVAALMAAVMLASYFPYLTYAIPAMAGLLIVVPMVEISAPFALLTYISASAVVFLTAENEAKILFILFFGYYPILKGVFERMNKRWLEYLLKFLVFNVALAVYAVVLVWVLGVPMDEFVAFDLGAFMVPLAVILGNIVFFIYDSGASRVITFYILMLHPKVKKLLK